MQSAKAAIDSLYDWWNRAGVDTAYLPSPESLLKAPGNIQQAPARVSAPLVDVAERKQVDQASAPLSLPSDSFPAEYDSFIQWLSEADNQIERLGTGPVILPQGELQPELMFIIGMPEENLGADNLPLSTSSAELFANMLRALGCESQPSYLAPIMMKRPLDGSIASAHAEYLKKRMEHLIGLVQPREIVILGDQACQNLLGQNLLSARQNKLIVNHGSSKTEAIATFPPRILVERPEFKAEAWKDLQMLSRMSVSS